MSDFLDFMDEPAPDVPHCRVCEIHKRESREHVVSVSCGTQTTPEHLHYQCLNCNFQWSVYANG